MLGERIFEFDCDLCDYIIGHLRGNLNSVSRRPVYVPDLSPKGWNNLSFPEWFAQHFDKQMPDMAEYIWKGVFGEVNRLPMNDAEVNAIGLVLSDVPMRFNRLCVWLPYPALHTRYVECVPEIRRSLTVQTAEEWAVASGRLLATIVAKFVTTNRRN